MAKDFQTDVNVSGNITLSGTVDGRNISNDGSKLDGIEAGAEVNPTDGEVKTAYENNANTNAFTDANQTKLNGIEAGAEVNVNADWDAVSGDALILNKPSLYTTSNFNTDFIGKDTDDLTEGATNLYFSSAERSKLSGIEPSATADQSDSEIETAYNNQVSVVSQAEAEAGTSTTVRRWTAQRVKQSIVENGGPVYENNGATVSSGDIDIDWNNADGGVAIIDASTSGNTPTFDMTNGKTGATYYVFFSNYTVSLTPTWGSNIKSFIDGSMGSIKGSWGYIVTFDGTNFRMSPQLSS
jgi:hypothetical protein